MKDTAPIILIIPFILAYAFLSACATAPAVSPSNGPALSESKGPAPDLAALHADIARREGTPHYDHWSLAAQREWETAFHRKHR
ncbi:MAG: hypothetical protein JJU00_20095 [Opitutales bacterium]|nr:hypothetical protein [Opitutales bacterium]